MWFDYKKAYDSVSHEWLKESLKLAKIPTSLYKAIEELTRVWATKASLHAANSTIETNTIKYLNGILQGDCLSTLLFILTLNPLSFLLNKQGGGYKAGKPKQRHCQITHLLFVDDLKTYAGSKEEALRQLHLITRFTSDIGMKFGSEKCAYINIEKGQIRSLGSKVSANDLQLSELTSDEPYKYLGIDEDIRYRGELTKSRVRSEYISRVRKIWNSNLHGRNKVLAHNTFAIPVLTPTFAVLEWTKEEVLEIDVMTRKQLTMSGSFHINGDIDRLYSNRKEGGRGLKSVYDTYITRIISVAEHVIAAARNNHLLEIVRKHETDRLLKTSSLFRNALQIDANTNPKTTAKQVSSTIQSRHLKAWIQKPTHGYLCKQQTMSKNYCSTGTNLWLQSYNIPSHIEGYFCAIQEQEIATRQLQKRRSKESTNVDSRCRHCKLRDEDICHIIGACSKLCSSMYLPFRHDQVARMVYIEILRTQDESIKFKQPEKVSIVGSLEVWWDHKIPCTPKIAHNRPDMVVWERSSKTCTIVDIAVPLDANVDETESIKRSKYMPLMVSLKRTYPDYQFECVPVVIGATGLVNKSLKENLRSIGLSNKVADRLIMRIVERTICGTVKVAKSALSIRK
jgi:hypothetical protein